MIILNNPRGVPKKEYIESVIESCKVIFSKEIDDKLFHDDNLKIAFCTSENQADVYNAFCVQFFPLYLDEKYSRTNLFVAQALTNTQTDTYGILICLDTEDDGLIWYQIILHEMSHIFCIVNELGGENFQNKYLQKNIEDTTAYAEASTGYAIWSEFVADYTASRINPIPEPHSLVKLRKDVRQFDSGVTSDDPDRVRNCTQLLTYILLAPNILSAPDVKAVFDILDKNHVLAPNKKKACYQEMITLIFERLQREQWWKISYGFIMDLGEVFIRMMAFEKIGKMLHR